MSVEQLRRNSGIAAFSPSSIIARCSPEYLHILIGKLGNMFHTFANGLDNEPVALFRQYDRH
jgi:hypothetical protein